MHPYTIIRNKLFAALDNSWSIIEEESHPDAFGSFFCVFSNKIVSIRLIWDGRDSRAYAQELNSKEWCDLPIVLTEMDIEDGVKNKEKIAQFCDAIKKV